MTKSNNIVLNFKQYIDADDQKKMRGLIVNVNYDFRDSEEDEYAHWIDAELKVKFKSRDKDEFLSIIYNEEQGCHTPSRYIPSIWCNIEGTKKAKELILKNLDIKDENEWDDDDYIEFRDMIKCISE